MTTKKNLLVELFVEELPPQALQALGAAFGNALLAALRARGLAGAASELTDYATPRRLAAHITQVLAKAADAPLSRKLMPVSVGLDARGAPTPALLKKLATLGADATALPELRRAGSGKAEALYFDSVRAGATLVQGLQEALDEAIARLPIPKVMSYQLADGWTTVHFVRPVHALVALHGAEVVPVMALGVTAGRQTHGHRFAARVDPIVVRTADSYAAQLADEGAVIASFARRRLWIQTQLADAARAVGGGVQVGADDALLDEVTALVEHPNVLTCEFDAEFLAVPQECLILTMKANQKYFPLLDAHGRLTNRFLVVSNIAPADVSAVVGGNERVVRARLADAKFFFDRDRSKTLAARVPGLARVVYHNQLGTQGERVERVRAIARTIGKHLGGAELALQADLASELAKADLLTDMVGEFPELQGIMGGYYARHDGLPEAVAEAIEDHYRPRFAGDALPRNPVGVVAALADKLETLMGLFGSGNLPSGDRDPFALRRHALGVIRMLVERRLPLALDWLLETAFAAFAGHVPEGTAFHDASAQVAAFIYERLAGSLREQGFSAQQVDAVLALAPQRLADVPHRLEAVRTFAALPEAPALAAANKRVANILRKAGSGVQPTVDAALLGAPAEKALAAALVDVRALADAAFARGDYTAALRELAALKVPVDAFFDQVMVNAEDAALRANRLGLLAQLHQAMNRVADLARLAA